MQGSAAWRPCITREQAPAAASRLLPFHGRKARSGSLAREAGALQPPAASSTNGPHSCRFMAERADAGRSAGGAHAVASPRRRPSRRMAASTIHAVSWCGHCEGPGSLALLSFHDGARCPEGRAVEHTSRPLRQPSARRLRAAWRPRMTREPAAAGASRSLPFSWCGHGESPGGLAQVPFHDARKVGVEHAAASPGLTIVAVSWRRRSEAPERR